MGEVADAAVILERQVAQAAGDLRGGIGRGARQVAEVEEGTRVRVIEDLVALELRMDRQAEGATTAVGGFHMGEPYAGVEGTIGRRVAGNARVEFGERHYLFPWDALLVPEQMVWRPMRSAADILPGARVQIIADQTALELCMGRRAAGAANSVGGYGTGRRHAGEEGRIDSRTDGGNARVNFGPGSSFVFPWDALLIGDAPGGGAHALRAALRASHEVAAKVASGDAGRANIAFSAATSVASSASVCAAPAAGLALKLALVCSEAAALTARACVGGATVKGSAGAPAAADGFARVCIEAAALTVSDGAGTALAAGGGFGRGFSGDSADTFVALVCSEPAALTARAADGAAGAGGGGFDGFCVSGDVDGLAAALVCSEDAASTARLGPPLGGRRSASSSAASSVTAAAAPKSGLPAPRGGASRGLVFLPA